MKKQLKQIELFCGIGAFSLAAQSCHISTVLACDVDKYACSIFRKNFPGVEVFEDDVRKLTADYILERYGKIDIITGGFPCVAFSIAGQRKGFKDITRGTLFFEVVRLAESLKPKYIILENVKGLINHLTETTFSNILYDIYKEIYVRCIWKDISIHDPTLSLLKKNLGIYILGILQKELALKKEHLGNMPEKISDYISEKGEYCLGSGLKKRLKYLKDQILQTMKNGNYCQDDQDNQLRSSVEELMLHLNQLYSLDNIRRVDILWLESIMDILADVELKQEKNLDGLFDLTKLYTTSMETNWTIDQKIYTCVQEILIVVYIIKLWASSRSFLKEILSNLINQKANIYYAKTFNIIIKRLDECGYDTEWQLLNSKYFGVPQNRERIYIVGHLRGQRTRKVFPVRYSDENNISKKEKKENPVIMDCKGNEKENNIADCLTSTMYKGSQANGMTLVMDSKGNPKKSGLASCLTNTMHKGHLNDGMTLVGDGTYRTHNDGKGFREKRDGLCPTIPARAREDGSGQPVVMLTERRTEKAKEIRRKKQKDGKDWCPRREKELVPREDELANCLTASQGQEAFLTDGVKVRRITPTECERLQNFPDSWTTKGITKDGKEIEISDTQRYRCLGNSITVSVLRCIYKKITMEEKGK